MSVGWKMLVGVYLHSEMCAKMHVGVFEQLGVVDPVKFRGMTIRFANGSGFGSGLGLGPCSG